MNTWDEFSRLSGSADPSLVTTRISTPGVTHFSSIGNKFFLPADPRFFFQKVWKDCSRNFTPGKLLPNLWMVSFEHSPFLTYLTTTPLHHRCGLFCNNCMQMIVYIYIYYKYTNIRIYVTKNWVAKLIWEVVIFIFHAHSSIIWA